MGPARTGELFEKWGFAPGPAMAVVAPACASWRLRGRWHSGLLTPAGSAVLIGTMLVAASPNAANGLWAHMGGCEVPVVYAGLGVVLAFTGPGPLLARSRVRAAPAPHLGWAVAAVVLGVVAAVPPLARRSVALPTAPAALACSLTAHNEVTP